MRLRRGDACLLPLALPGVAAWGEEKGPLRVGWGDYPPFQRAAPNGPLGLDVEPLNLMARVSGERLEWLRMPWARQLLDLALGQLGVMSSGT